MNIYGVDRRSGLRTAALALLLALLCVLPLQLGVYQAQAQEGSSDSGVISSQVAAALFVAIADYQKIQKDEGRSATASALASQTHAVAYAKKGNRLEIHILEGTPFSFGGGVSYTVDLENYGIVQKRFGR